MIFCLNMKNINAKEMTPCDELLDSCAIVVKKQQETINLKDKALEEQFKEIQTLEKRVEDLDKSADVHTGTSIGLSTIILILLLL